MNEGLGGIENRLLPNQTAFSDPSLVNLQERA